MTTKVHGRIIRWHPDMGYGFARPHKGQYEVLIHSMDVRCASRSPEPGDEVRYQLSMDKYQRPWGREVEIAEEGVFPSRRTLAPYVTGLVSLLLVLGIILA